jgi:RNA polymerase sigma-70 factor, ECF subfamily
MPEPLENTLEQLLVRASEGTPHAQVNVDRFVRHLAERARTDLEPLAALAELHVSDLYLAFAALEGDPAALTAVDKLLSEGGRALHRHYPEHVMDEVLQAVRSDLLVADGERSAKLARFSGRGALVRWLRTVVATKAARLLWRDRVEQPVSENVIIDRMGGASAEVAFLKGEYGARFRAVFHEVLRSLSARERNVLRMRFIDGLTTEEIGSFYNVHRTSVARWVDQATDTLLRRTRASLTERLGVTPSVLDSLMRVLTSELEGSLAVFLQSEPSSAG